MATSLSHLGPWTVTRVHGRYSHVLWVLAAWALGFAISAVFSGVLELPRARFVAVYLVIAGPFLGAYAMWSRIDLRSMLHHRWLWGIAGAVVIGAMMVASVQGWDASPRREGLRLAFDILWLGVVYGTLDALFLSVLPVVAIWRAFPDHTKTWTGKIVVGALAFAASMVMAATYHLGYAEFRGDELRDPLVGNGIFTLGYLLTMNPVAAIVGHVVLHVSSVLRGAATTISLPPHY